MKFVGKPRFFNFFYSTGGDEKYEISPNFERGMYELTCNGELLISLTLPSEAAQKAAADFRYERGGDETIALFLRDIDWWERSPIFQGDEK